MAEFTVIHGEPGILSRRKLSDHAFIEARVTDEGTIVQFFRDGIAVHTWQFKTAEAAQERFDDFCAGWDAREAYERELGNGVT